MSATSTIPALHSRLLARFAWFAVFYNVLVIVWGALVRASGSGAGCGNHWPLCNGQVIPVSPGFHTIIEFTHRMMTGGSTFIVIALLVWAFRATAKGHAARWFAIASMVLLLNEAFLGALLVKLGYVTGNDSLGRIVVLSIHLSNTLLLMAALTLTARFLSTGEAEPWAELHRARGFGWAVAGLAATIAVGVSGSMAALGDTLFPASSLRAAYLQDFAAGSPWLLRLRLVHPASASAAAIFVIWLVGRGRRMGCGQAGVLGRVNLTNLVLILLAVQFALGVADVLLLAPAWMQLLHLLGADLYWVALVLLAAETVWPAPVDKAPSTKPQFDLPVPARTLA
jgi:cytochrome c oxidase assembly protein subunit 15